MSFLYEDFLKMPGPEAARESAENTFLMRTVPAIYSYGTVIGGAARDTGNTGTGGATTILRAGLAIGQKTSDLKYYQWDPTASDGTQIFVGFLATPMKMLDPDGNNADRQGVLVIQGAVKNANVYQSQNINSYGVTNALRAVASHRFMFDDDFYGRLHLNEKQEVAKTAAYTVLATDAGTLFTNTAAVASVTFTLPAVASAAGLSYEFLVVANQNVLVTSAEGSNVVTFNNASASTVAFQTAGQLIGGKVHVWANMAGTKWYTDLPTKNAVTIT